MTRPGLLTDRYELTMLSSLVASGLADAPAVFSCFSRHLPAGRRYGVLAGTGRLVEQLASFAYDEDELSWLVSTGVVTAQAAQWLRSTRLAVDVDAYPEGELWFPGSPVLTVRGSLGQAVLLETLVLSVLNADSAVASAAARMSVAAGERPLVEMGSRRTHEEAAVSAARAAYLAGFTSTSNLAAGRRYGIPTAGTAAHAFVLAHPTERDAFTAQVAAQGPGTTLLVDTYDTEQGIRTAVEVAGPALGAVRIDSGDLGVEVRRARALLDALGATGTRILVTSDLDEHVIASLAGAPVDAYGVGTRVVTGSGAPTCGFVYKLVEVGGRPVAKRSAGKSGTGGDVTAVRRGLEELVVPVGGPVPEGRVLPQPLLRSGAPALDGDLEQARRHHLAVRGELPDEALSLEPGEPAVLPRR